MANKKVLVFASGNKHKIKQIGEMLPEYDVKGYKEMGVDFDIEENGNSFYENALIKAKIVGETLGVIALADDSGVCVDALGGAPGIYSARYAGDGNDEHNNDLLLKNLEGKENRKAKYVCALVMYNPNGEIVSAEGECYGEIMNERKGSNGFGYDPIFFSYELGKTFGESPDEERNKVSHRYKALMQLKSKL